MKDSKKSVLLRPTLRKITLATKDLEVQKRTSGCGSNTGERRWPGRGYVSLLIETWEAELDFFPPNIPQCLHLPFQLPSSCQQS